MASYQGSLKPDFSFSDFRTADGRFDIQAELKAETVWVEKIQADLRSKAKGDLVGEELRFPRGDGYARYLIAKQRPFTLVHLELGDAWHADGATIRGFRLQDARVRVEAERRWKADQEAQERATQKFYEEHLGKTVHYHDGFNQFIRCEVVRAAEDVTDFNNIKKGELCLKETALVGKWRSYDLRSDSIHMRGCREGRLMRPNLGNVYEFSKDLQKQKTDPRGMEPCVMQGQQDLFAS